MSTTTTPTAATPGRRRGEADALAFSVYVRTQIGGRTGGNKDCPIHELPVLRRCVRRTGMGLEVSILTDWPKLPLRDEEGFIRVDENDEPIPSRAHALPRARPLSQVLLRREWDRLYRVYGKVQIGEGVEHNFLADVYGSLTEFGQRLQAVSRRYWEMSQGDATDLSIEQWRELEGLADPSRDEGHTLEPLHLEQLGDLKHLAAEPHEDTKAEQTTTREVGLVQELITRGVNPEAAGGLVALLEQHPDGLEVAHIVAANLPTIGASQPRAGALRKLLLEVVAERDARAGAP